MTIRRKTILILAVAFTSLVIVSNIALYLVVSPKFLEMERQEVHNNVDRVMKELNDLPLRLKPMVADWAYWDDTYDFLKGRKPDYPLNNLTDEALLNLSLEVALFLDGSARPAIQKFYDVEKEVPLPPEEAVTRVLVQAAMKSPSAPSQGFVMAGGRSLAFAASPVLRSNRSGPNAGFLVFARHIDSDYLKAISNKLNLKISLISFASPAATDRIASLHPDVFHDVMIYLDPENTDTVSGYATLLDVNSRPIELAQVSMPRSIYQSGRDAIMNAAYMLLSFGALFSLLVIVMIDRVVLSRLAKMSEKITRPRGQGLAFEETEKDEIGVLAATIEDAFGAEALKARELEAKERRKELALTGGDVGYWEYDIQSQTVYFSQRFMSMLGFGHHDLPHSLETWNNLLHHDDRAAALTTFEEVLSQKKPVWDMEYRLRGKDGKYRNVHSRGRVVKVRENGDPAILSGTHMDVTEKVQLAQQRARFDEQLRQSQKMKALGTLAGGIAHNFNNILAAIMGYSELVLDDLPKNSQNYENVKEILTASARAGELVRQMLVFSHDRDKTLETTDIRKLVEETFKFMREVVPTSIEMVSSIPDTPILVSCDTYQMREAFVNISTNAVEALSKEGGRLIVTMAVERNVTDPKLGEGVKDLVKISFTDNGKGMDDEVKERAFDPYYTTKGEAERIGLGLAVVHGVVAECGGWSELESQVGRGTTVTITLPAVIGLPDDEQRWPVNVGGSEKILFVDDERLLTDIANQYFSKLGYDITPCLDAFEALEKFQKNPEAYSLVITDYAMGEMNGLVLAAKLHEARPELPIMLCSGYIDVVDENERIRSGITEVLHKPVSLDDLAKRTRQVIDKSNASRPPS